MADDVVVHEDVVIVGRIGGAYGVRGWVHVSSFTDPPENLLNYSPWLIVKRGAWEPVEKVLVKPHGHGFVAQLDDIDNRDQAMGLKATDIAVHRDTLPGLDDKDEFYWRDLVGLEVMNSNGRFLGVVSHLLETPAHDVLVIIEGESGAEILIPFTAQFVHSVDIKATRIEVDW